MRILITGASGSGTTTLARALCEPLDSIAVDADDYYWLPSDPPFRQKRAPDVRLRMILAAVDTAPNAIVSGSVIDWGAEIEDSFDLIVFLYLDAAIRVERLRAREIKALGAADPEFLDWAAAYDEGPSSGRSLAKHTAWLIVGATQGVDIATFKTGRSSSSAVKAMSPTPSALRSPIARGTP